MNGFATTVRQINGNLATSISKHFHAALQTFNTVFSKFLTYAVENRLAHMFGKFK